MKVIHFSLLGDAHLTTMVPLETQLCFNACSIIIDHCQVGRGALTVVSSQLTGSVFYLFSTILIARVSKVVSV